MTFDSELGSYAEIVARLKISEGARKIAMHRLRKRYREACREEVAQTVCEPSEIEGELRYLCEIISEDPDEFVPEQ